MDLDRPPDPGGHKSAWQHLTTDDQIDSPPKIKISHPSTSIPYFQVFVNVHPSFSEVPKTYTNDDQASFIFHISWEVSYSAAGTTLRAIKFGKFLHTKLSPSLMMEQKTLAATRSLLNFAHTFMSNLSLKMCKYKTAVPT